MAWRAAAAVSIGLFVGAVPAYGFQLALCLAICVPLRLDAVVAYVAAHISNPFTVLLLLLLEVEVGSQLLYGRHAAVSIEALEQMERADLAELGVPLLVGIVAVGVGMALVGGAATWAVLHLRQRRRSDSELDRAITQTRAGYADAPASDRHYVAIKLRTDPVVRELAALPGHLGSVVDAGAGRGQLLLLRMTLGKTGDALGFDTDARKIDVARAAMSHLADGTASSRARFEVASMAEREWPPMDTVLFIDSLHYLPRPEQDQIVTRAAHALRPGGRMIVREVDLASGVRGRLAVLFEHVARLIGLNLSRGFAFRSAADVVELLRSAGLSCDLPGLARGRALGNVAIVGHKPAGVARRQA